MVQKKKESVIILSIIVVTIFSLFIMLGLGIHAFLNPPSAAVDDYNVMSGEDMFMYMESNAQMRNPLRSPRDLSHLDDIFLPINKEDHIEMVGLIVWPGNVDRETFGKTLGPDEGYFGEMLLETPQDPVTINLVNGFEVDFNFLVKLFYNYEEVPFRILGEDDYNTELIFTLNSFYQAQIPIQLDGNLEVNEFRNKLTAVAFMVPDLHIAEFPELFYFDFFGFGTNYEMSFGGAEALPLIPSDIVIYPLEGLSNGFTINDDIDPPTNALNFPPNPMQVRAGEEIELSLIVNAHGMIPEEVESVVIISLLDWQQIEMNDEPFLFFYTEDNEHVGQHVRFTITAPEEPGYYEFTAISIPNPTHPPSHLNYFPLDLSTRFTIEVIE